MMKRRAGSFIRNDAGELEENLKDPAMKARKEIRETAENNNVENGQTATTDQVLPPEKMLKEQLINALVEKGIDPPDEALKEDLIKLLKEVTANVSE
jgi:hypothetical protein